ncbi:hypothetical protein ACHAPT_008381 [Fusarium lateritium]
MPRKQRKPKITPFHHWGFLPAEIQRVIFDFLKRHNSRGSYAAVCKGWQSFFEEENFRHLKLGKRDLDELEKVAKPRRRKEVIKGIWLSIKLAPYSCESYRAHRCRHRSTYRSTEERDAGAMESAIIKLFGFLESWSRAGGGDLSLEFNCYSTSDRKHWHQNCFVGGPGEDGALSALHDPKHGWEHGQRVTGLRFERGSLPKVTAVTTFTMRRQCRIQFPPETLNELLGSFPRLQCLVWEPWRQWDRMGQRLFWDAGHTSMINETFPKGLNKMSVFEDFNEEYAAQLATPQWFIGLPFDVVDLVRVATPSVGSAFAFRSLQLEELSVSFKADARHFFTACQPEWRWERLRFLALTSRIMTAERHEEVAPLLLNAARVAMRMPELQTMALWNGAKGEACAFTFRREDSSITWKGTWEMELEKKVVDAWRQVIHEDNREPFRIKYEEIYDEIFSHGDAIHYFGVPAGVIDPVSLWQIRHEHVRMP